MKNLLAKMTIILLIAILESSAGLPVLFLGLVIFWAGNEEGWLYSGWIISTGLFLGVLWQLPLWLAVLSIFLLDQIFRGTKRLLFSKLLRIVSVTLPFSLWLILWLGIDFGWRIVIYAGLSIVLLVLAERLVVSRFDHHYL
jgi:hypothetical protein